jgi:gas vesicle protein
VFYTGSDDGLVYLTKDGGENWTNVTPKGLPETLINAIEISLIDPATAYIATTRYKFNDYTPAIYKTSDYGKTWVNISSGIPYGAFTRVVREDSKDKDLLYAGTEKGIYISRNRGTSWEAFQLNLPVTPITDLKLAHEDLIVATSGRSFWILDDLSLVREMEKTVQAPKIYTPEAAYLGSWSSPLSRSNSDFDGTDPFEGVNPANGMVLYYHLPENTSDTTKISLGIYNADGNLVRMISSEKDSEFQSYPGGPSEEPILTVKKGINRFVWDMRYPSMPGIPTAYLEASYRGHQVIPGDYKIILKAGSQTSETSASIAANPLYEITMADYQEYETFMTVCESELTEMHQMVNQAMDYQKQLKATLTKTKGKEALKNLHDTGNILQKSLQAWDEKMIQRKSTAYDDVENFPNKFTANYLYLINQTESSIPKVNKGSKDRFAELWEEWKVLKAEGEKLLDEEIPAFNKNAQEAGIGTLYLK